MGVESSDLFILSSKSFDRRIRLSTVCSHLEIDHIGELVSLFLSCCEVGWFILRILVVHIGELSYHFLCCEVDGWCYRKKHVSAVGHLTQIMCTPI